MKGALFHILFEEPLIAVVPLNDPISRIVPYLAEKAGGERFHCLFAPSWALEKAFETRLNQLRPLICEFPQMRSVILAQKPDDIPRIREAGLECLFANHNSFLDESTIYPEDEVEPVYDAIYNARLLPYKRHHLAYQVENMAVITAKRLIDGDAGNQVLSGYKSLRYSNYDPETGKVDMKPPEGVRHLLSLSRCGLALSAIEGAMYASGEYGLAGLPIVSTPSLGGRDQFYHDDWVKIVEPDPIAIARTVADFKQDAPGRDYVRRGTLGLMMPHRERLIHWLEETTGQSLWQNASPNGWLPQFTHRMLKWHKFPD